MSLLIGVDLDATKKARKDFPAHPEGVVARFLSPVWLYRILDEEELVRIVRTGYVTGGTYSVRAERSFGASWGTDLAQILQWGRGQRGGRLGDRLYLARLEGRGRVFYHLDLGLPEPIGEIPDQIRINPDRIGIALGASIPQVQLAQVDLYRVPPQGPIQPVSAPEIRQIVQDRPVQGVELRPINPHLYQGQILGVDVRVVWKNNYWSVWVSDTKRIVTDAKSVGDATQLAQMAIRLRPSNPVPVHADLLEQVRKRERQFETEDHPDRIRGEFPIRPRMTLRVQKGSVRMGIRAGETLTVADLFRQRGEREVRIKILQGGKPHWLYVTHPNRLGENPIALLDHSGARVLVERAKKSDPI